MSKIFFLLSIILGLGSAVVRANDSVTFVIKGKGIHLQDSSRVITSMLRGDSQYLREVASSGSSGSLGRNLAITASRRLVYDFNGANASFKACEGVNDNPDNRVRQLCSLGLAGDYFIQRDMPSWIKQMRYIHDTYNPLLQKAFPGRGLSFYAAVKISGADLSNWPPYKGDLADGVSYVDYVPNSELAKHQKKLMTIVKVRINGKYFNALLDTGSSFDLISAKVAAELDIKIRMTYLHAKTGANERVGEGFGVANEIKIGANYLENWPVLIAKGLPFDAVLGIPFMSKLHAVRFSHDGVTIGVQSRMDEKCSERMRLGSSLDGSVTKLVTEVEVGGEKASAYLDTGTPFFIMEHLLSPGVGAPGRQVRMLYGNGKSHVANLYERRNVISVGRVKRSMSYWAEFSPDNLAPYVIGSDVLLDQDVFVDFSSGRMCIF